MKALTGIKVIDFSKWLPGQYCGMVLGDFGADVIKVETPTGDDTRRFFPEALPGMSYWHLALNRNKRGITADIKTEGGRKLLLRLLSEADVFLEGFRPGYLARYGLDYATVREINPQLVYCSITGFGQTGSYRHKPAHDLNVIGLAGLNSLDDVGSACVSEVQIAALGSSMNAVSGILLALLARERTGPNFRRVTIRSTPDSTMAPKTPTRNSTSTSLRPSTEALQPIFSTLHSFSAYFIGSTSTMSDNANNAKNSTVGISSNKKTASSMT